MFYLPGYDFRVGEESITTHVETLKEFDEAVFVSKIISAINKDHVRIYRTNEDPFGTKYKCEAYDTKIREDDLGCGSLFYNKKCTNIMEISNDQAAVSVETANGIYCLDVFFKKDENNKILDVEKVMYQDGDDAFIVPFNDWEKKNLKDVIQREMKIREENHKEEDMER